MLFENAHYDSADHKTFTLDVTDDELGKIPFTYLCDGSDDLASLVSKAVGDAFRAGQFEVSEYEEPEDMELEMAAEVRFKRDTLLAGCDYYMMPDYPASEENKTAVAAYRQNLRNISLQSGFPATIEWPEKPSCLA